MSIDRKRLLGHVRKWILGGDRGESCTSIALVHLNEAGRGKPVRTWDVTPETVIETLVTEMSDIAEEDATNLGDRQRYAFGAYSGRCSPGIGNYFARYAFTLHPPPTLESANDDEIVEMSENATTPKGHAQMSSKFSLDLMKQVLPWAHQIMSRQEQTISRQAAEIESLYAERRKNVILHERVVQQSHKRQLQLRKVIFWEKKKEEAASIIFPMLAPLFMAAAGKQLPSGQATKESVTFEHFINSFTDDEQLMALQARMKPSQLPAVGAIVMAVKNKQPINAVVLREFLKSIDEPQMESIKEVLSEDQKRLFFGAIAGFMKEHEEHIEKMRKAQAAIDDTEPVEETDPVGDDDVFE